jgi:hypothetical protein
VPDRAAHRFPTLPTDFRALIHLRGLDAKDNFSFASMLHHSILSAHPSSASLCVHEAAM